MNEPSSAVPAQLLPHIHLVSTYRYPTLAQVSLDTIVDYLLSAPKITRELAAMNWTFLDAPPDGSVLLVWQPLNQLGTRLASDGYVWADPEQAFSQEHKGYIVEMYIHRSGYHPPHEALATHCRRRYRLTPSPNASSNYCDPHLWIIHYARADQQAQFPAARIPVNQQIQATMTQRRFLQQHGQLVRKEFMLHDRSNWPTINPPVSHMAQQHPQQVPGYPANMMSQLTRSQQQSYAHDQQAPNHQVGMGPSPAKRPRQTPPSQRPGSSTSIAATAMAHDVTVDEEEDTSRGDLMDFLTPRDISTTRYTQHHEWMEEIFSSPYPTDKITPVDLGLGRKGELEALTKDFFEAPTSGTPLTDGEGKSSRAGRLDLAKAEEFTRRASEKITVMNSEMEKMKRKHARRMNKLGKGGIVHDAEKRLRSVIINPSETGTDVWKINSQSHDQANRDATAAALRQHERIDEIAREVGSALNRTIEVVKDLNCVQRGGLEEKTVPEFEITDDLAMEDPEDTSMNQVSQPPNAQPTSYETLLAAQVAPNFPATQQPMTPSINASNEHSTGTPNVTLLDDNIEMGQDDVLRLDTDGAMIETPSNEEPQNKEMDPGEWVMVDKEGDAEASQAEDSGNLDDFEGHIVEQQNVNTPGEGLPDFTTNIDITTGQEFDTNDFGDAVDFGNLDTAGDALAGYGEQNEIVGADEHGDLGLEDSAFGEAFHQTEPNTEQQEHVPET